MVCLLNEVRMHGASVSGVPTRGPQPHVDL